MDTVELKKQFLQKLRIAINAGAMYSKDHPIFFSNADELNKISQQILKHEGLLKISVSPASLKIGPDLFEKDGAQELAGVLHLKKIKSISILSQVDASEIKDFLIYITMFQVKDDIQKQSLFESKNIAVKKVDYSDLLENDFFKGGFSDNFKGSNDLPEADQKELEAYFKRFEALIKEEQFVNLGSSEDSLMKVEDFLAVLKDREQDRYLECAKDILKTVLNNAGSLEKKNTTELVKLADGLDSKSYSDVLWDKIFSDKEVDSDSLTVISKLIEDRSDVKNSFKEKIKSNEDLLRSPHMLRKVRELFSRRDDENRQASAVYSQLFSSYLDSVNSTNVLSLDNNGTKENYIMILLDLLEFEQNHQRLMKVADNIKAEWNTLDFFGEFEVLKRIYTICQKRLLEDGTENIYQSVLKKVSTEIDSLGRQGKITDHDVLEMSACVFGSNRDVNEVLDDFFDIKKVNLYLMVYFFKFFSDMQELFFARLDRKKDDIAFLKKLISLISKLKEDTFSFVLKHIYCFANVLIKKEIINVLTAFPEKEGTFFLEVIKTEELLLRRPAYFAIQKNEEYFKQALEFSFSGKGVLGLYSRRVVEDLEIIEAIGNLYAMPYVEKLTRRKLFINKKLRLRALEVMGKLNERDS